MARVVPADFLGLERRIVQSLCLRWFHGAVAFTVQHQERPAIQLFDEPGRIDDRARKRTKRQVIGQVSTGGEDDGAYAVFAWRDGEGKKRSERVTHDCNMVVV